ncbi:hypothetical protein ABT010_17365 [Streptomyces sp. NPDC002668]
MSRSPFFWPGPLVVRRGGAAERAFTMLGLPDRRGGRGRTVRRADALSR